MAKSEKPLEMTDKQLSDQLKAITAELIRRKGKKPKAPPKALDSTETPIPPPVNICADLLATADAVHQAIIDNNCQPL
jgi:hypothetical protein